MYDGKLVFIITGVNFHTSFINFAIINGFPGKVIYYSLLYGMKKMIIYPPATQLNIHHPQKRGREDLNHFQTVLQIFFSLRGRSLPCKKHKFDAKRDNGNVIHSGMRHRFGSSVICVVGVQNSNKINKNPALALEERADSQVR